MKKKINIQLMNIIYKLRQRKNNINKRKRGSELAQTIFITGIMVIIIATAFFPQMKDLMSKAFKALSEWFDTVISKIGA